jgi:homoserine kinase type II
MLTDHSVMQEVLAAHAVHAEWEAVPFTGAGTNNTTRLIKSGDSLYVLRIYESHKDQDKIRYEHEVLLALSSMNLPFATPVPQRNKEGETFTILATNQGKIAALFTFSEGHNPQFHKHSEIYSFGESIALLSHAMNPIKLALSPVYPPYYQLDAGHPACSADKLLSFCNQAPADFQAYSSQLYSIGRHIQQFNEQIPMLMTLPHQLIHGDLNRTNVLVDDTGKICAILDFEFVTRDLRVMELAVALTDICNPAAPTEEMWLCTRRLLSGYFARRTLTSEELQAIPTLLTLRKLDVFIHFLGRYWDGVNDSAFVIRYINELYQQLDQAEQGLQRLRTILTEEANHEEGAVSKS